MRSTANIATEVCRMHLYRFYHSTTIVVKQYYILESCLLVDDVKLVLMTK